MISLLYILLVNINLRLLCYNSIYKKKDKKMENKPKLTKEEILKKYPKSDKDTLFYFKQSLEENNITKEFIKDLLLNEGYSVPILYKILRDLGLDIKFKKSTLDKYILENIKEYKNINKKKKA